jgi:PAS domain S-box-containing protein
VDTQWRAALGGAPYDIEHRILVDGQVKWVREKAYLEFDQACNLLGGFGISQDITERKLSEEKLRESEERFRTLANAVPSIVWTAAPDGTILYSNEHWYKYTGINPENNASNWAELVLHPDDYERCVREWTHALETVPDEYLIEVRNRRHDGQYRWFQTRAIPIRDVDGKVIAWYGVTTDIHDRIEAVHAMRESQQQLQFLNESLEQKVNEQTAEVRRLTANLTKAEHRERRRIAQILHEDLQQRLYTVKLKLALLIDRFKDKESEVEAELLETNHQIDEILALTRNLTVQLSPPILRDEGLTQALTWLASQMYQRQGLQIEIQAGDSFAIRDEAVQVLLFNCVRELLFNIVKHAGVNRATVALQHVDDNLRIEVRDEGKGFNVPSLLRNNKNVNYDNGEARASFGLPTLRYQLGLLGGKMDIQSEPGAGTRITITIPYS